MFYVNVPIRPGETFIDSGWLCIDKHISVDHYLPRSNDSVSDHYFSCCHATFTYEYQKDDEKKGESVKRVAHAYYNRFGIVVGLNIREVFPGSEKPSLLLTMKDEWRAFLYEQASLMPEAEVNVLSYPGFVVQQLLKRQQQHYCQLVEKSQDQEKIVAQLHQQWETHAFNDQDKVSLIAALEEFLRMINDINLHDRFGSDKRGHLISDHLEYVRHKICDNSLEGNEKTADVESEQKSSLETGSQEVSPSVKKKQKHHKKKKLSSEKIETSMLTSTPFESRPLVRVDKIDQVLTQLKGMHPYAFRTSLFVSRNIAALSEYFSDRVRSGALDEVVVLYPFIVNVAQSFVAKEFETLFENIVARNFSPEETAKLIPVIDFLYNNSEYHRSLFSFFSKEMRFRETGIQESSRLSLLAGFFTKNNLPVFSMLLRFGVDPDGSESYSIIDENRVSLINFILSSVVTSGLYFSQFIDVLDRCGAFDRGFCPLESIYSVDSMALYMKSGAVDFYRVAENVRHFFAVMVTRLYFSVVYPIDVFTTLASRTDIKTLLFSMPHLLSSYHVYVVVGRAANEPVAVENRDQLERISLGCTSEDYKANFSVIVYPGTSKEGREVKCFCDIFNSLLSEVKRKFRALAKDEQLRIVDFLINSANRAFGNDPFQGKEALTLSVTALVAHNLLTDLTINDYIVRLKLLILCGRMNERQEVADISRAAFFYGAARELIEGIPHEIRENDKIALIIEEILIRCLVSEQTDKQLKTCLLASNSFRQQGKTDEAQRMLALTFNRLNIRQCINLSNPGPKERLVVCAMRFFSKDQRQEFLSFLQASPSK